MRPRNFTGTFGPSHLNSFNRLSSAARFYLKSAPPKSSRPSQANFRLLLLLESQLLAAGETGIPRLLLGVELREEEEVNVLRF